MGRQVVDLSSGLNINGIGRCGICIGARRAEHEGKVALDSPMSHSGRMITVRPPIRQRVSGRIILSMPSPTSRRCRRQPTTERKTLLCALAARIPVAISNLSLSDNTAFDDVAPRLETLKAAGLAVTGRTRMQPWEV